MLHLVLFVRSIYEEDHAMKDIIVTDKAPKPIGPYSQAVRANGFLFTAQIALEPNTNTLLEETWGSKRNACWKT